MTGIAWQRQIRDRLASGNDDLFGKWWESIDNSLSRSVVKEITSEQAASVILQYEWLGTMPQAVRSCFGLFCGNHLAGALVFAERSGSNLDTHKNSVIPSDAHYLARGACVHWAHPHAASFFIAKVCRDFVCADNGTVMAYADPAAGEVGTIYQALGWYYLGPSKGGPTAALVDGKLVTLRSFKRDRKYSTGQSLSSVASAFPKAKEIVPIGRKHRYIGIYGSKSFKREMAKRILPHTLDYPKREQWHD